MPKTNGLLDLLRKNGDLGGNRDAFFTRVLDFYRNMLRMQIARLVFVAVSVVVFSSILIVLFEHKVTSGENGLGFANLWDGFFWAVTTQTTTGYGDRYPVTDAGKIVSILVMTFGSITVSLLSATIASIMVEKKIREGKGLMEFTKMKNHLIICGWKQEFGSVLSNILRVNPKLRVYDIVLINEKDPELVENLKLEEPFKNLNYIHGDFTDESILKRANIKEAKQMMILADNSPGVSKEEIDAKTVLAAMTLEKIARRLYVCAEIFDAKFEKHLHMAHCDEVILTREYAKSLLAHASVASGVSHVLNEITRATDRQPLQIIKIPKKFINVTLTFRELFDYFKNEEQAILVGLLENTGNFFMRKKEALREAQKTPDISKLVDNLQTVKQLKPSEPIFNPPDDYVIKRYSRAIIFPSHSGKDDA